jgi:hypothetical protein
MNCTSCIVHNMSLPSLPSPVLPNSRSMDKDTTSLSSDKQHRLREFIYCSKSRRDVVISGNRELFSALLRQSM